MEPGGRNEKGVRRIWRHPPQTPRRASGRAAGFRRNCYPLRLPVSAGGSDFPSGSSAASAEKFRARSPTMSISIKPTAPRRTGSLKSFLFSASETYGSFRTAMVPSGFRTAVATIPGRASSPLRSPPDRQPSSDSGRRTCIFANCEGMRSLKMIKDTDFPGEMLRACVGQGTAMHQTPESAGAPQG